MEEQLIIDVWETFKDHISEKNKESAATQYVDFLISEDVEVEVLEGLLGYDPHLDNAIELVLEEHKEEESEYEEDAEDDWGDEEEDY